jgi:hypothetical protein
VFSCVIDLCYFIAIIIYCKTNGVKLSSRVPIDDYIKYGKNNFSIKQKMMKNLSIQRVYMKLLGEMKNPNDGHR